MKVVSKTKDQGIHYTPADLADFLAESILEHLSTWTGTLTVLDPACGNGALLLAFHLALSGQSRKQVNLIGFETDPSALKSASNLLVEQGAEQVRLECADFLDQLGVDQPNKIVSVDKRPQEIVPKSHVIIANPPYVRTQVLGAKRSQQLAQRFNLRGRVDLYHAFTIAMANTLQPGGILGLLTSNRFLTTNSGRSLRKLLQDRFELLSVFDLGDTKLFKTAAVLPVIVIARKREVDVSAPRKCLFARIYERRGVSHLKQPVLECVSPLAAMKDRRMTGVVQFKAKQYLIERGELSLVGVDHRWTLQTRQNKVWLDTVRCNTAYSFHEIAQVRVGVKTTADDVFIQDWESLPKSDRPEDALLRPLLTHRDAGRWLARRTSGLTKLLYPHEIRNKKRCAVRLDKYPRAKRFLEQHKDRLSRRKYVLKSGRHWYEIWVPHKPDEWAQAKIVCPDISEVPRFFFDRSGAVVNGDCYWLTLRAGVKESWLFLMLAVANSTFITQYYDTLFHNKLYSGRRRFMAQYVKQFPVPDATSEAARTAIQLVRQMVEGYAKPKRQETNLDRLVWRAFGLEKDV